MKKLTALLLSLFYTVTLLPMGFSKIVVLKEPHLQTLKQMACTAAAQGKIDWLETLERINHALLTSPNEQGATPLFFAAQEGQPETVQWLIEKAENRCTTHECFLELKTQNGQIGITPLHIAAAKGHAKIIHALFNHWLKNKSYFAVDCFYSPKNRTPLHCATSSGHIEAIQALFDCKADMHNEDRDGITPLILAGQHPNPAVFEEFQKRLPLIDALQSFDKNDELYIVEEDIRWIESIIAAKVDIERKDPDTGATALILAAQKKLERFVKILITAGANVWARNNDGLTAFQLSSGKIRTLLGLEMSKSLTPEHVSQMSTEEWFRFKEWSYQ